MVELFPTGGMVPDYGLATSAGLTSHYRYLSSWPRPGSTSHRSKMIVSDIEVDLAALDALLDELGVAS